MEQESTHIQSLKLKPGRLGGLKHLERLLGVREDGVLSIDAVFIYLDLEVASDRQRLHLSAEKPVITQLAFASLYTRDVRSLSTSSDLTSLILLQMFEVDLPLKTEKTIKAKEKESGNKKKQQCIFAQTRLVTLVEVSSTIIQSLCIRDAVIGSESSHLRNIVLVGHSLGEDLRILRLLGIDPDGVGPIPTIIDTHSMARFLFPPYHPNLTLEPGQDFSLAGVLAKLGCLPHRSTFHNAGNDALYSLYAMLLLAIKAGTGRLVELSTGGLTRLEIIKAVVSRAVEQIISHGFIQPPAKAT